MLTSAINYPISLALHSIILCIMFLISCSLSHGVNIVDTEADIIAHIQGRKQEEQRYQKILYLCVVK